jgi:hypothetical protein
MRRFKSARHLQRFASVHDQVGNLFPHCRYTPTQNRSGRFAPRASRRWKFVPFYNLTIPCIDTCITSSAFGVLVEMMAERAGTISGIELMHRIREDRFVT